MAGESATLGSESLAFGQTSGFEAEPDVTTIDHETPVREEESGKEATGQEMTELQIDPEFKDLIPPLCQEEFEALKENLSTYGCHDRLTIWKGQNILLDGHHRYQICTELGIPFETKEIELPSRADAKIWIIMNQRGRRNLNESQRAMLAVTLNDIYCEQAKERMGTRTDLGQNLAQCEVGRSAEKAAKDMGVSHQTVSYAKKVVTSGVPELKQMVDVGQLAVSTAARVADLSTEDQDKVQTEIQKISRRKREIEKISPRVTSNEVARIIREIRSHKYEDSRPDIDRNLQTVENRLRGIIRVLDEVETTTQREKLIDLINLSEDIISQIKAIGVRSPVPERKVEVIPGEYQLEINANLLDMFLESVVPLYEGVKLKFDNDGLRIIEHDKENTFASSAFMPKSYFSKYELEPCEICLRRIQDLSGKLRDGRVQIFVEPETTYHHDRIMKIYSGYEDGGVTREDEITLIRPDFIRKDLPLPELGAACKFVVSISSKDFVGSLRDITRTASRGEDGLKFYRFAEFSVEDSLLKIVAREDKSIQKIRCNVLVQGEAASEFNIAHIADGDIGRVIEKSDTITLGLGKDYPLIIDLTIGRIEIRYIMGPIIKDTEPEEYEEYRGVLVDREGNPVDQPTVEYRGVLVDPRGNPIEPVAESVEEPVAEPTEESLGTKERRVINPKRTLPEQMPGEGPVESEILN